MAIFIFGFMCSKINQMILFQFLSYFSELTSWIDLFFLNFSWMFWASTRFFKKNFFSELFLEVFCYFSVHTFSYLKSNWRNYFGYDEKKWFEKASSFVSEFLNSNFKVNEKNGVWTKIRFLDCRFSFARRNLNILWTFWSFLFPSGLIFLNPFIVLYRSNFCFLFSQWKTVQIYTGNLQYMFLFRLLFWL